MVDARRVLLIAAAGAMSLVPAGCFEDADCGICNDNSLELQIISGTNYTGELVHIVSPECVGERCPSPFTEARRFVETLGLCEETDAALAAGRGPWEYCRIAPIVAASGLEFIFNNLLEPTSVELVRTRPDVGNRFEIYQWKTRILGVEGPISRYAGDWRERAADDTSIVTRFVNLSCVDNLREQGLDFSAADYAEPATNPCTAVVAGRPAKLQMDKSLVAPRGRWDDRAIGDASAYDCDTPADGVDNCCSQCDFSLSVMVSKYGASGTPMECDPQGDRLIDCADFVVADSREDEPERAVPAEDLLRSIHPALREGERATIACDSDDACRDPSGPGLPGAECVGTDAEGRTCSLGSGDPGCGDGVCRAPWFVECKADPDTTGAAGFCVDARFDARAAAACFVDASSGARVSECDADADGVLTAAECCPEGASCDPIYADGATPLPRYDRKGSLPSVVRSVACDDGCGDDCGRCTSSGGCSAGGRNCTDDEARACLEEFYVAQTCDPDEGDDEHDYAVNLVTKVGGVIYDGALKGVQWRPADRGGRPRAVIEACAEERGMIAARTVADGWRANDADGIGVELEADWDLSMCSGQEYQVVFARSDADEHVVDPKGNTLDGKRVYGFRTSQFHVVPSSGFPGDNLRIGACDTFSLAFSNKYDLSPENLEKIELHDLALAEGDRTIAGGRGCASTRAEQEASGAPPCLQIDVGAQAEGQIRARVDAVQFEPVLESGRTYGFYVPGVLDPQASNADTLLSANAYDDATSLDELTPEAYAAAFWDACGMPLFANSVVREVDGSGAPKLSYSYDYTFTVDPVRCDEDADGDGIALSCDNAPRSYNPLQSDTDADGVGDALDLCAASPEISRDTSDSDGDGIGNGCDNCPSSLARYNELAATNAVPTALWVRNGGDQTDTDGDGIGDVCDNCPSLANCEGYDLDGPWRLGDPIDPSSPTCQRDADFDMVGDQCVGLTSDLAAGPVGFGDADDFDQDGLANLVDGCPRQPELDRIECDDDADCGTGRRCAGASADGAGICNHLDGDGDGVGDICDTCAHVPNALQTLDGGAQDDDPDGDFIGADCELGAGCGDSGEPRPIAFFPVSSGGLCCTTLLVEDGGEVTERHGSERVIVDADGRPVVPGCSGSGCSALPPVLVSTPGVLTLPLGCEAALAAAGLTVDDHVALGASDVQGDLDALWGMQCRLPPIDQDYDGLGDACDLCPFDFDPTNASYVDDEGRTWPNDGAACSGGNSLAARCEDEPGGGDDGEATGDGGGSDSSGG